MSRSIDRIFTSVPFDKTAAMVTGKGEHYEPAMKPTSRAHSDVPLPMVPAHKLFGTQVGIAKELTGTVFGRMTVKGLSKFKNPKKKAMWVCRCACGNYEQRTAKAIRNPGNSDDCCERCRKIKYLKRRYDEQGAKPLGEFIGDGKRREG